ncbi:MAG: TrkA family potassium uptake protein [Candidatus Omnitrophica bacterium]|nr:TrkA family potassium uptake protein [Candidatus Omnitrophota bacterium]
MRQYAVIGLGKFGQSVAVTLAQSGEQVIGVDSDPQVVKEMADKLANVVEADATNDKNLIALGIKDVDVAIVSVGENFEASILITLALKDLGVPEIIVKAKSDSQAKVLEKVGATRVVNPEKDMGIRVAKSLVSPRIIDHIELSSDYSLLEMSPPKEFVGKSLKQLDVRAKYGINVIAVKHEQGDVDIAPSADHIIKEGDLLVVIGKNKDIDKVKKKE